jgi:hypothetical protein
MLAAGGGPPVSTAKSDLDRPTSRGGIPRLGRRDFQPGSQLYIKFTNVHGECHRPVVDEYFGTSVAGPCRENTACSPGVSISEPIQIGWLLLTPLDAWGCRLDVPCHTKPKRLCTR